MLKSPFRGRSIKYMPVCMYVLTLVFPRFVSATVDIFGVLIGPLYCLCSLWLAKVITLVWVLRHSIQNHSIWTLFSNRSQKTSKWGKYNSDTLLPTRVSFFLHNTSWTSSVTYYWTVDGNLESICKIFRGQWAIIDYQAPFEQTYTVRLRWVRQDCKGIIRDAIVWGTSFACRRFVQLIPLRLNFL